MTDKDKERIECAIRHIKSSVDVDPWAMEIAVDAMLKQLSEEGTTKDTTFDCISRQAVIDAIINLTHCTSVRDLYEYIQEYNLADMWIGGVNDAIDAVIAVQSVQPERKKGKWVEHHEPFTWMGYTYWTCSECNFGEKEENKTRSNFCPHCGAEMVENSVG